MVKTAHSSLGTDPATKQREEGEISSQSMQPRYNQETERAIAQVRYDGWHAAIAAVYVFRCTGCSD